MFEYNIRYSTRMGFRGDITITAANKREALMQFSVSNPSYYVLGCSEYDHDK